MECWRIFRENLDVFNEKKIWKYLIYSIQINDEFIEEFLEVILTDSLD